MNARVKIIILLIVTASFFSFLIRIGDPITVGSIRESMLLTLFSRYDPADSTIFIKDRDYQGEETDSKLYAVSLCYWDASFMPNAFSMAIDTSYIGYDASVRARVVSLFGADVIKGKLKTAAKDYEGKPIQIYQYNAAGIQAVFNKLYQKPSENFRGLALQKLYNASSKQFLRDATDVVVGIMAKKTVWDAQVKKYIQQVATNEEFYMDEFAAQTYQLIFGEKEMNECAPSAIRLIGSMLRRSGDGTLPTLMVCLKTVLKDYDPEYYNKVALKF